MSHLLYILVISFTSADIFGNLANIIYTIGSSIKNSFFLRFAIVIGCAFEIIYYFQVANNPLWTSIIWATVIIAINVYFILVIYYEKYKIKLTDDEKKIYNTLFSSMELTIFSKFMKLATYKSVSLNENIIIEGKMSYQLILLLEGMGEVVVENKPVAYVHNGAFIGEMSFLTGNLPSATVRTTISSRIVVWDNLAIQKMADNDSTFQQQLQKVLSSDIIIKLTQQTKDGGNRFVTAE